MFAQYARTLYGVPLGKHPSCIHMLSANFAKLSISCNFNFNHSGNFALKPAIDYGLSRLNRCAIPKPAQVQRCGATRRWPTNFATPLQRRSAAINNNMSKAGLHKAYSTLSTALGWNLSKRLAVRLPNLWLFKQTLSLDELRLMCHGPREPPKDSDAAAGRALTEPVELTATAPGLPPPSPETKRRLLQELAEQEAKKVSQEEEKPMHFPAQDKLEDLKYEEPINSTDAKKTELDKSSSKEQLVLPSADEQNELLLREQQERGSSKKCPEDCDPKTLATEKAEIAKEKAKEMANDFWSNMPDRDEMEKQVFKVIAKSIDGVKTLYEHTEKNFDKYVAKNPNVQEYWKKFMEKLDEARKDNK